VLIGLGLLMAAGCKPSLGISPEVQILTRVTSPGGQNEARLYRIIGGPGIGGAVVWQELRITPPNAPVPIGADSTIALTSGEESETPAFSFHWVSANSLIVTSVPGIPVRFTRSEVGTVQIHYTPH
jgi:hypothetical protein